MSCLITVLVTVCPFLPPALIVGCSGHVIVTVSLCCHLIVLFTFSSFLSVALIVVCGCNIFLTVSLTVAFLHL